MKSLKSLFMAAVALSMFAACSQNEDFQGENPGGEVISGEETYASFKFNVVNSGANTRAAMVGQAADEAAFTNGHMLIFDAVSGALLNNEVVDISPNATNAIKTTSGSRRIYVIVGTASKTGIIADLATLTVAGNSTLSDFYKLMTDGQASSPYTADMGAEFGELLQSGKFVMSNVADASAVQTLEADVTKELSEATSGAKNQFTLKLYRAVAKGNLTLKMKEDNLKTADGVFELKPQAYYGVRNVNRSTRYVQQYGDDELTLADNAASTLSGLRPWAAFYDAFDNTSDDNMKKLDTYKPFYYGGYAINGTDAVPVTIYKLSDPVAPNTPAAVYFTENSNNKQVNGNTTYFGITTQVDKIVADKIAATFTFADGKFATTAASSDWSNTAGTSNFYYLRKIPTNYALAGEVGNAMRRVFKNESDVFQAIFAFIQSGEIELTGADKASLTNATLLETAYNDPTTTALSDDDKANIASYYGCYVGGKSYYRLDIYETITADKTKRHLVRRNHNYNAVVSSFATIGAPTEDELDKDPEKPVDSTPTYVSATIGLEGWTNVGMTDEL